MNESIYESINRSGNKATNSQRIRERHFAVDILASAAGGALVSAIVQKSWLCGLLTVVLAAGVYVFDRIGIEAEEEIEKD